MNFIETLRSVGGVKPCLKTTYGNKECPQCHGTGTVLDLAPLLAKPTVLHGAVDTLLLDWWDKHPYRYTQDFTNFKKLYKNLYIVGPQRAHSLVYECARQLGGTAVVAEPRLQPIIELDIAGQPIHYPPCDGPWPMEVAGYCLSLPIPPDATVLFVTDRLGPRLSEITDIVLAVRTANATQPVILPYLLCLVDSRRDSCTPKSGRLDPVMMDHRPFNIISLYE